MSASDIRGCYVTHTWSPVSTTCFCFLFLQVARAFVFATVVNKIRRPYRGLFITVPHGQSFEIMKTSVPRRIVGCIGKCTSGLTPEELDHVTDHIHKTLTHPKGRKMFKEYLKQAHRKDDLACLKFYEKCSEFIEKEENYQWVKSSFFITHLQQ